MDYELDSTMYNGEHLQSQSDWESHNINTEPNKHTANYIYSSWFKLCCCHIKILCDIQFT